MRVVHDAAMNIIEAFLYRNFILTGDAERLKQGVPQRQRRQKK
jgi:hypothetical protein